jgi:excisionase family DNA binding protein
MDELLFYTAAEVAELLRLNHQVVLRKLQAGEIPGYKIGKEWRIERGKLLEWLEERSNQRGPAEVRKILDAYFDSKGRLKEIPAKRKKRQLILRELAEHFEADRAYKEREVNAVLRRFHPDVATLRRELVASRLLVRTRAGVYKRTAVGSGRPSRSVTVPGRA